MTNKKLLAVASIALAISTSSAFAKTEGNYAGFSIIRSDIQAKKLKIDGSEIYSNNEGFQVKDDDQISAGINYKYAFNLNGFFVAPGAFFDYTNLSTKGNVNDGAKTTWNLDYRLGARVDLGYDITNELSAYVQGGFTHNAYSNKWNFSGNSSKTSGSDITPSYGVGVKYTVVNNVDLNLEYEMSKLKMDVSIPEINKVTQEFDLKVIKVGVAYHF